MSHQPAYSSLPGDDSLPEVVSDGMSIPRMLYTTYPDQLRDMTSQKLDRARALNPGWEVTGFGDAEAEALLDERHPRAAAALRALAAGSYRADVFRAARLLLEGSWVGALLEHVEPLERWVDLTSDELQVCVDRAPRRRCLWQAVFACPPSHVVLMTVECEKVQADCHHLGSCSAEVEDPVEGQRWRSVQECCRYCL